MDKWKREQLNRHDESRIEARADRVRFVEAHVQAKLMEHPNFREAYDAFVEKRAPVFE